jgi:hypothetical protein
MLLGSGIGAIDLDHCRNGTQLDRWAQSAPPSGGTWPQIFIISGELPRVVNDAEDALLGLGREIFQRGGQLVRPVLSKFKAARDRDAVGWRLVPVTRPYLAESLSCAARFLKYPTGPLIGWSRG